MNATKTSTVEARIVYNLEKPHLLGMTYSIDQVVIEYTLDSEEVEPYVDITIKGWRLTSRVTIDRRQNERDNVYLTRSEREEFVKEDLGIDYEADLRELLGSVVFV